MERNADEARIAGKIGRPPRLVPALVEERRREIPCARRVALARAPAFVRFASRDARRADPGRPGAARPLDDRDDDALRAPESERHARDRRLARPRWEHNGNCECSRLPTRCNELAFRWRRRELKTTRGAARTRSWRCDGIVRGVRADERGRDGAGEGARFGGGGEAVGCRHPHRRGTATTT